jgi:hypothetical protein
MSYGYAQIRVACLSYQKVISRNKIPHSKNLKIFEFFAENKPVILTQKKLIAVKTVSIIELRTGSLKSTMLSITGCGK